MKKIIIYFTIFGFFFGLLNTADYHFNFFSSRDFPGSMYFNFPTILAAYPVSDLVNNARETRGKMLAAKMSELPLKPFLLPGPLLPTSRQEYRDLERDPMAIKDYYGGAEYFNLVRNDSLIGENGVITIFTEYFRYFIPIISAIVWGAIGSVFYLIIRFSQVIGSKVLLKKSPPKRKTLYTLKVDAP